MVSPKSASHPVPKAYAFIDSQNLNVGTQKFGWKMNWARFRKFLAEEYGVTKAFMFIGYIPENEALYEQMHDAGYMVVLKPTFDITRPRSEEAVSEEDKKPVKGNIDADLVLWAMKEMSNYQKAIIVSGDGDFFSLVEYLVSKKKITTPHDPQRPLFAALSSIRRIHCAFRSFPESPGISRSAA